MVNDLSLVADIFVEKLALVVFIFLYTKRSENETIQVSSKGTNELSFLFSYVFYCSVVVSVTRHFFLTSFLWKLKYHKIWYLIYITSLILIISDTKWVWRSRNKLEQSLPDTKPWKSRFWKKNTMQTCNKSSTAQLAAYVTKMKRISIYHAVNVTLTYIINACSYRTCQLYYFVEKKRKYTCINYMSADLVDLSLDGVDVLINE